MARIYSITIFICCLCLNVNAQSGLQSEAADTIGHEEYTIALGRAFFGADDFDSSIAFYEKVDTASMGLVDLCNYAMAAFFEHQYQKTLDIARYGLSLKSDYTPFNRLAFFCCTELQQYDLAGEYADSLFNQEKAQSDSVYYYDHAYLVKFLCNKPHHDEKDWARLKTSCLFLIDYYTSQKDDKNAAIYYAKQLIAIDPENERAKAILTR